MTDGPLAAYRARRLAGKLQADPAQAAAAEKLQSLHNALKSYQPSMGRAGWRERLGLGQRRDAPPQGLYLFGGVGRGKSMLMDLFFESAPAQAKRRTHFHAFMLEVHDGLNRLRQQEAPALTAGESDPLLQLAEGMARQSWLLCFDELVVNNIADAMLLGRLFSALLDEGVVMVATSNFAPEDLYKGGLQRELFLPFIALLEQRLDLLELDGPIDFRLARLRGMTMHHTPLGAEAERHLGEAFRRLTDDAEPRATMLRVQGRSVPVAKAAKGVAWFGFDELCSRPLGAADYLALAMHFHSVIVSGIPALGPEQRNEARRFITLIDALYEHKVDLICSASVPPERLYARGDGADEFRRTVSRLIEMQSEEHVARPHLA